jgi:uncharacterized membrane protein YkvA (DUF1232 family)
MTDRPDSPPDPDDYTPRDPDEREALVRDGLMDKVRRTAGRVPFVPEALAAWFCAQDPATPVRVKAALIAALAYFVVPVDAVPDIIAGLGFTDDATVFYAAYRMMRDHITDAHRDRAERILGRGAGGGAED